MHLEVIWNEEKSNIVFFYGTFYIEKKLPNDWNNKVAIIRKIEVNKHCFLICEGIPHRRIHIAQRDVLHIIFIAGLSGFFHSEKIHWKNRPRQNII